MSLNIKLSYFDHAKVALLVYCRLYPVTFNVVPIEQISTCCQSHKKPLPAYTKKAWFVTLPRISKA